MRRTQFDRSKLTLKPLSERDDDMTLDDTLPLDGDFAFCPDESLEAAALAILRARSPEPGQGRAKGRPVIAMFGAHVIKTGCSLFLIDMMERGFLTHLATNGAGAIHDFELALIGATTEGVARYIKAGEFGLWKETGRLNDVAMTAARENIGFGEALGREITQGEYPHKDASVFAAAYRSGLPITVHVAIGQDIVHEHPNCDGASWGAASYTDFLIFAESVRQLEGGVFLNIGSAVCGPEVFLKALAMARNVATRGGAQSTELRAPSAEPRNFTTVVFDLVRLGPEARGPEPAARYEEPGKAQPEYYFRPLKTLLVRTVQDAGHSLYIRGDHRSTIPTLHRLLAERKESRVER
jgi:hypothetical protein